MIIHQSLYGDRSGSYSLLKTTLENTEIAKHICNTTDLMDRPSGGQLTQPVIRSFLFNEYYLFIKSFPDLDPGIRPGRVLSHTLIINKADLVQLNDLNKLFSYFLSYPDKNAGLNEIEFSARDQIQTKQFITPNSREAAV